VNSLPPSLVDFRRQFERAVERDLARRSRVRPLGLRGAVVVTAAAAAGVGLSSLGVFGTHAPSIVERASAALAVQEGTILHVVMVGHQDNGDGTTSTWRDESWQSTSAPYERRQIEHVGADPVTETSSAGEAEAIYDSTTNTVYTREAPASLPATGKLLRWKTIDGKVHRVIVNGGRPAPPKTQTDPIAEPFRREVLELLRSGGAREDGHVTRAGRDAVRIVGNSGNATYFVDAKTYDPIEFRTVGERGSTSLRFDVYETLQLNASTRTLLSVVAQHPDARVSTNLSEFTAAQQRLFPHG
jgi:hypothetical protein